MTQKKQYKSAVMSALFDAADEIEEEIRKASKEEKEADDIEEKKSVNFESEETEEIEVADVSPENLVQNDLLVARRNLKKLIGKGNIAVDQVVKYIKRSGNKKGEYPRGVEDLCALIKTLVVSNKELINIHEIKSRVVNPSGVPSGPTPIAAGGKIDENGDLLVDSSTLSKIVTDIMKDKFQKVEKKKSSVGKKTLK